MSEWWTYRLSSFLLFSPHTYGRLIERYNASIWPWQLAGLAAGLAIAYVLVRPSAATTRMHCPFARGERCGLVDSTMPGTKCSGGA